MNRRPLLACLCGATVALGGCGALRTLPSDVSSYSLWPAERKPASYAFERLPSQQAQPEQQQTLEDAARPALQTAGFTPAGDVRDADVTIQLGARVTPLGVPYADPFWWGGRFGYGSGYGYGYGGYGYGYRYGPAFSGA